MYSVRFVNESDFKILNKGGFRKENGKKIIFAFFSNHCDFLSEHNGVCERAE